MRWLIDWLAFDACFIMWLIDWLIVLWINPMCILCLCVPISGFFNPFVTDFCGLGGTAKQLGRSCAYIGTATAVRERRTRLEGHLLSVRFFFCHFFPPHFAVWTHILLYFADARFQRWCICRCLLKYECAKFNRTPVEDIYEDDDVFKRFALVGSGFSRIPGTFCVSLPFERKNNTHFRSQFPNGRVHFLRLSATILRAAERREGGRCISTAPVVARIRTTQRGGLCRQCDAGSLRRRPSAVFPNIPANATDGIARVHCWSLCWS